ncbi:transporter substrate-binding domain-containing protein [Vibrio sp. S4M6]|uniref:substrate-binding periplasmic protein n=1 Tax=Vibrio sinus TaxID=2946865 RepID=UPI00202A1328|nr:transporter substrate-binding domain-containing protein [Vibrio sinus]MCL9781779.1 transporter substrate-binding domain-containing protein [Vibrio sinus]
MFIKGYIRNFTLIAITLLVGFPSIAKDIYLVTGYDYPPYADKNLPNGGFASDLVVTVFSSMDNVGRVSLAFEPWKRGYDNTKIGKFLATFPYRKTADREKDFLYSDPIVSINTVVFINHNSTLTLATLEGAKACLPLGYTDKAIKDLVERKIVTLQRPTQLENCFQMMKAGRVDFIPINDMVGNEFLHSHSTLNAAHFKHLPEPISKGYLHLMVSKQHPGSKQYIKQFNKYLERIKSSGQYNRLKEKHNIP